MTDYYQIELEHLQKWANIQSISKNKKRHRRQQQQDFLVDVLLDPDSVIRLLTSKRSVRLFPLVWILV